MSQHEANIEAKIDQKSIQNRFKKLLEISLDFGVSWGGPGAETIRKCDGKPLLWGALQLLGTYLL